MTFDLVFLAQLAAVMDFICTNFDVDSSSHFPTREQTQTYKVTDATDHPIHWLATAGTGNNVHLSAIRA